MNKCLNCDKEIKHKRNTLNKYCNNICEQEYLYKYYIKRWKNGKEKGYRSQGRVTEYIRKYLYEKYDNECCKCGWHKINQYTNKIPLEVSHIDGNYKNCKEENLELLCPNCHSLTPNFRSRNKNDNVMKRGTRSSLRKLTLS